MNPDYAGAISEQVLRAATDEAVRADLRRRGLERAAAFTWDRTAAAVHALLTGLADDA